MSTTEITELIGEQATATSLEGADQMTGVLIPPALEGRPPRLHADDDQILEMVPARWSLALVDRRPKGSRRMLHCPDGRPLYRWDDLPTLQLATVSMLKRARLRPAEGQEPIATYLVTGYSDYAPLYAVADAAGMPPLPAGRQAAWEQARTCARCGTKRQRPIDGPFPKGVDGRRYCADCQEPAAAEAWRAERAAGRARATEWAKGVRDVGRQDPEQVVLLHIGYRTMAYQTVMAQTWTGRMIMDVRVCTDPRYSSDYTDPAAVVDRVRALQGRRLVGWRHEWHAADSLLRLLEPVGGGDISLPDIEAAGPHWDQWCALRRKGVPPTYPYRLNGGTDLREQQPPGWDRVQLLGHIHHAVTEMAHGHCYWWRVTCQDPDCGRDIWFGTSLAANEWSNRHHAETGHTLRHTTEPGMNP